MCLLCASATSHQSSNDYRDALPVVPAWVPQVMRHPRTSDPSRDRAIHSRSTVQRSIKYLLDRSIQLLCRLLRTACSCHSLASRRRTGPSLPHVLLDMAIPDGCFPHLDRTDCLGFQYTTHLVEIAEHTLVPPMNAAVCSHITGRLSDSSVCTIVCIGPACLLRYCMSTLSSDWIGRRASLSTQAARSAQVDSTPSHYNMPKCHGLRWSAATQLKRLFLILRRSFA